jgi:hypothetical protein
MWEPGVGSSKYPPGDDWPKHPPRSADEYKDNQQVGILLGKQITESTMTGYVTDIDVDWAEGIPIAQKLLPRTGFTFGHKSKPYSHLFYCLAEPLKLIQFRDVGPKGKPGVMLLEIRGTKTDGSLGLETMVPPSIWISKDGKQREPLEFCTVPGFKLGELVFVGPDELEYFKQRYLYTAIGMLLAKNFGHNGFGHEVRKAWAGFLLRAGVSPADLIAMGEGISSVCNNLEVHDVRTVVESTATRLQEKGKKISGGAVLAKMLGDNGRAIIGTINEWLGRERDFYRNAKGAVAVNNQQNVYRALDQLGITLQHNKFSLKNYIIRDSVTRVLEDADVNSLRLEIDREFHVLNSKEFFGDVIDDLARQNTFHPVQEYLDRLVWDQKPRLDNWLTTYAKAQSTPFVRAVSAIVLIAAVRRVRKPGCKFDEMLVLISAKQGTNKSTGLRTLCPDERWFSDDVPLNVDAKQIIERTGGKWFIEASELQGFSVREEGHLKALLSRQGDGPVRLAYGRMSTEIPRQFIFVGTTNTHQFLKDKTGNRRFWPVEIEFFNIDALLNDRDQLWAEAAYREAKGESIRLDPALYEAAEEQQEKRRIDDPWEEYIEEAISKCKHPDKIPSADIWSVLGTQAHATDSRHSTRVAGIMQRFGYIEKRKCRPIKGAEPCWCWIKGPIQYDFEE